MEGNLSVDRSAKEVAVLYMLPGDRACQFHDEKIGYHDEMVLLRPQAPLRWSWWDPTTKLVRASDLLGFHPLRQLIHGYLQFSDVRVYLELGPRQAKLLGLVTAPASSTPTEMGYLDELVLLRPQGTTEVVVLAADFDNTQISSPAE